MSRPSSPPDPAGQHVVPLDAGLNVQTARYVMTVVIDGKIDAMDALSVTVEFISMYMYMSVPTYSDAMADRRRSWHEMPPTTRWMSKQSLRAFPDPGPYVHLSVME